MHVGVQAVATTELSGKAAAKVARHSRISSLLSLRPGGGPRRSAAPIAFNMGPARPGRGHVIRQNTKMSKEALIKLTGIAPETVKDFSAGLFQTLLSYQKQDENTGLWRAELVHDVVLTDAIFQEK